MLKPKRKVSPKKEIVMGFTPSIARAERPASARRGAAPKELAPIFDRYKAQIIDNLKESIDNAKGRYGWEGDERVAANPLPKTMRAKNWRVVGDVSPAAKEGHVDVEELNYELVEVVVRVGTSIIPFFTATADVSGMPEAKAAKVIKEQSERYEVRGGELVVLLHDVLDAVTGITKDSELGQVIHKTAIEAAGRKAIQAGKKYDAEKDNYI